MQFDYIKTCAYTPSIKVADVEFNTNQIKKGIDFAVSEKANLVAFPELCITGATCGDLFFTDTLLNNAKKALKEIADYTKGKNLLVFLGLPIKKAGLIYNVCAGISDGVILGLVPKTNIPNDDDQKRYFATPNGEISYVVLDEFNDDEDQIPFGTNIIFADSKNQSLKICCEIGSDLQAVIPPSVFHAVNGARIIVNISADSEFSGRQEYRKMLIKSHSQKIVSAYIYVNAGEGESTTDAVYSGHNIISENGETLAESKPFSSQFITAQIDLSSIDYQRSKTFNQSCQDLINDYLLVGFSLDLSQNKIDRIYSKTPFIKLGEEQFLIDIAAYGLKKRIEHVFANKIVIGVSGGLDSTLALIIASRTMELLNRPKKDIIAITMPCFGTSKRTFDNSIVLSKAFGVTLKKIEITKAVKRHLKDINHSEDLHDASYENSQARERTQVLMDYANSVNGIVVGTGDLSELALGWATYNGDHMSMYAVNGSIPKTLVRHLVDYTANANRGKLKAVLKDILDTPVSPELIPSKDDKIGQVTEDLVGPYILHDFFLYNLIKRGFTPTKTYLVAVNTFNGEFDKQTILKWLKTFIRRFFNQQFKRSCLPDGVKVSEISLSPRGSYKMPSDAISKLWLDELEQIKLD